MITLDDEAKRLVSTFVAYRNDIDIYTEDEENDKEFYKELFKKLLGDRIKINDVTPLGCKNNVIERCSTEPDNGRRKIFIIDGDVSIIHGKNIPKLPNLFVLDAYCVENYLIDENSIIEFIFIHCGVKSRKEIAQDLSFEYWLNECTNSLIELFIHFAIADIAKVPYTLNTAYKYHKVCKREKVISTDLILPEIEDLKKRILGAINTHEYDSIVDALRKKWTYCINNLLQIVSGKDYLIPILLLKTQSFMESKALPNLHEVKIQLVQYCDLTKFNSLKNAIENIE